MNVRRNESAVGQVSGRYAGAKVANPAKPKELVLVVEDEALIRMNSADMIRDLGFEVIEAVDAEHAVSLLESIPGIGVVFTDIQMPGSMDGLMLAAVVRDRWPPIAVLITSGKLHPLAADMPAGARFMTKPYSPVDLQEQLRVLTGRC
jgi:two-component system, response regulator PdtaR